MKKNLIAILVILFIAAAHSGECCTTFCLRNGSHLMLGKNFDFYSGAGLVVVNQRNLKKTSYPAPDGNTISWVSRFGSVTFNQFGKEFPFGGMNERGLVIESMWLNESSYPSPDPRQAMFELQWIQYQLDNAATVDDVVASDKRIRISRFSAPIHFLVADAQGNAATIEFINGQTVVHAGKDFAHCALSNSPYRESAEFLDSLDDPKEYSRETTNRSNDRFVKASVMARNFDQETGVEYGFSILDAVKQGDFTRWSIVYDIGNGAIHYKTQNNEKMRTLALKSFNFSCDSPAVYRNIDDPLPEGSPDFLVYSPSKNSEIMNLAFAELDKRPEFKNIIPASEERDSLARYPETMVCHDGTSAR